MIDYKYNGITPQAMFLMSENRFRNSREFYEEHKEELKQGIVVPIRQVIAALADTLLKIDPQMSIAPEKMVSRIRRDTRFTKDKRLYRENLWTMFMRDKHALPYYPCMWFEVSPECYSGGIGTYYAPPRLMELYRNEIAARPRDFEKAVKSAEKAGCVFECEAYKKEKAGCPKAELAPYYNVKSVFFIYRFSDVSELQTADFIEKIRKIYVQLKPMYVFLLSVSEKYMQEIA